MNNLKINQVTRANTAENITKLRIVKEKPAALSSRFRILEAIENMY